MTHVDVERLRRLATEPQATPGVAHVGQSDLRALLDQPVDMVLFCPACGMQHIDAPDTDAQYAERLHESAWWELGGDKPERWDNPPHRSHLCRGCGHIWRPADVPTNGVVAVKTRGKNDSPPAAQGPRQWVNR